MRIDKLDPPIDLDHDHILGPPDAELTLVEYGSYACPHCHAVHDVIAGLRNRFGERMRYVFRHLPVAGSEEALRASELAEYAFTMSLFIAGLAFPNRADYAAAKIAIFIASLIAAGLGTIILYPRRQEESESEVDDEADAVCSAI
jgi:NhaA family Na+:H+ antiporter